MSAKLDLQLTGIDRVTFAVDDFGSARQFADDWGLTGADVDGGALFRTVDGTEVLIVPADGQRADRTPIGAASGLVEIVWGVRSRDGIDAAGEELSRDRTIDVGEDGIMRTRDDLGFGLGFRRTERGPLTPTATLFNAPGVPARIDQRAARYVRALPQEISHVAINVANAGQASLFYEQRLGFIVSDRYAERGVFMRCAASGNHHHLFLMNGRDGSTRFNHLAFKVRDIHEVIAGGQHIDARGWTTFAGPGRHAVSSANFWYFHSPFGGSWEYAADEDIVSEAWEAQDFAAEAHIFSEWTFGLEKSDGTLRGPIAQSAPRAES